MVLAAALAAAATWYAMQPSCQIKGNIDAQGRRVFYMPHDPYYSQVVISEEGERLFCSEKDAMAAGFIRKGSE